MFGRTSLVLFLLFVAGTVEEGEEEEMDTLPTESQDKEQSVRTQAPILNQLLTSDVLSINDKREAYVLKEPAAPTKTPIYVPTSKTLIKLQGMDVNQQQRIMVNVGGTIFVACATTLQADPSSILAKMVQKDSPYQPYELDMVYTYFVDRDPRHFRTILDYLRNMNCVPTHRTLSPGSANLEELLSEIVYYELTHLEKDNNT